MVRALAIPSATDTELAACPATKAACTRSEGLGKREMPPKIKLESVKETGKFLIEIMPIMFIPAGVGLMTTWGVLQPILLPVSIITAVTIITVMVATGWVSQIIIRKSGEKKDE